MSKAAPQPMAEADVAAALARDLPAWRYADGAIARELRTADWASALLLTNAIGFLAEAMQHHPDVTITWGRVHVRLWSHDAQGVTRRDLRLAAKIDALTGPETAAAP